MEAPICNRCLASRVLCSSCSEKLRKGEISEIDIQVSREMFFLRKRIKDINHLKICKVLENKNSIVVLLGDGDLDKLTGKVLAVVRTLSRRLNKRVRLVENTSNVKKLVEEFISPVKLLGLTVKFLPNNQEVYKIIISKEDMNKLPIKKEEIENFLKKITKKEFHIEFY